jgi:hypothetical protein
MRPYLLVTLVLGLTAVSTMLVLHLRREEVRRCTPAFVVGVVAFNLVLYGLLVLLIP